MCTILCFSTVNIDLKLVTPYILNAKRNYTLLFFSISSVNVNVFWVKISHIDYMATGVYRTLMSGRFDPMSVVYFNRMLLCNVRT